MTPETPDPTQPQGLDIGRLIAGLARRWPLIFCAALAGIALGFWVQRLLPTKYVSTVSILLDPKRPGGLGEDGVFAGLAVDNTKIGTVASIIGSSSLLKRVVQSEDLADDPDFGGPLPSLREKGCELLLKMPLFPLCERTAPESNTREAREARALYRLTRAVSTNLVAFTYVIDVQVVASKASDAQRLAAAIGEAYLNDQFETRQEAARRDTTWLAKQLTELRSELINSEQAVEEIRRRYGLTETTQGQNATTDRQYITDLNGQLTAAESAVATQQARYEQVQRLRRDHGDLGTLPDVAASQTIHQMRASQSDIARKIADLSARYTPRYSELIDARRDQQALDAQIDTEIGRIVDGIRNDYQTAVARRDELKKILRQKVDASQGDVSSEGRIKLREAQRVLEANQAFYDAQLRRLREADLQKTRQEVEARILSPADLPDAPKFPKLRIFVLGGAAFGLLTGLAMAFGLLLLENRGVTIAWAEDALSLPVLGALPMLGKRVLSASGHRMNTSEYLRLKPLSLFAEALRSLRVGIRNATPSPPRIIHVTSAVPGEGKSTVAAALAVSAAIAGIRTVLVDVDIRNSSVTNMFNLPGHEGVVDIVRDNSLIGSTSHTFRQFPLTVIAAGASSRLKPDTIGSPGFGAMIQQLGQDYDLVIMDSPPVLAVSDAVLISNAADATLFVVQWRTTSKELVRQGVKALRSGRAPLVGIVFNKIDFRKARRYEGPGYGNHYGSLGSYVSG